MRVYIVELTLSDLGSRNQLSCKDFSSTRYAVAFALETLTLSAHGRHLLAVRLLRRLPLVLAARALRLQSAHVRIARLDH